MREKTTQQNRKHVSIKKTSIQMIIAALLIINQEMETTHSSRLPEEADGPKGPLLLPKLQFLMEFR